MILAPLSSVIGTPLDFFLLFLGKVPPAYRASDGSADIRDIVVPPGRVVDYRHILLHVDSSNLPFSRLPISVSAAPPLISKVLSRRPAPSCVKRFLLVFGVRGRPGPHPFLANDISLSLLPS